MANNSGSATQTAAAPPAPRPRYNNLAAAQARLAERQRLEGMEAAKRLQAPQPCADEDFRLHDLACEAGTRAERIRGSRIPEFDDANSLRMEREAKEEALGCLRWMAILKSTSTPLDPLEAVREAQPPTTIKKNFCKASQNPLQT